MKYIFSAGKIKETFYQANVVCGVFFYDSVCPVEATLATYEIFFFANFNHCLTSTVLLVTKALVFSLTTFVGISCGNITSAVLTFLKLTW